MQTLGLLLLALLAAVLVLVILALVLPLRVWVAFDTKAERYLAVRLQPFGRWGPIFPVTERRAKKKPPRPKAPKEKKSRRRVPRGRFTFAKVRDLLSGVIAAIHFEELRVDADFGLGDPADTGQAFGMLAPIMYGTPGCADLQLRPVFDRACLSGQGHLRWRIRPATLLWPFVRFGWAVWGPVR